MKRPGQMRRILADLLVGRCVDAHTAPRKYGCARLAARIYEIREMGYRVTSRVVNTASGPVTIYKLV